VKSFGTRAALEGGPPPTPHGTATAGGVRSRPCATARRTGPTAQAPWPSLVPLVLRGCRDRSCPGPCCCCTNAKRRKRVPPSTGPWGPARLINPQSVVQRSLHYTMRSQCRILLGGCGARTLPPRPKNKNAPVSIQISPVGWPHVKSDGALWRPGRSPPMTSSPVALEQPWLSGGATWEGSSSGRAAATDQSGQGASFPAGLTASRRVTIARVFVR